MKLFEHSFTRLLNEAGTPPPPPAPSRGRGDDEEGQLPATDEEAAASQFEQTDVNDLGASQEHMDNQQAAVDETDAQIQEWIDDVEAMTARLNDPKDSILQGIKRGAATNEKLEKIVDAGVVRQIAKCAQTLGALVESLKSAV